MFKILRDVQAWHRESLLWLEREHSAYWSHFADVGAFDAKGAHGARAQVALLVHRLRRLLDAVRKD
jgi:hypothetical protein